MVKTVVGRLVVCALVIAFLSGCVLVPIVDGVKQIGVTKSDRMALLSERVQRFNHALYWGRSDDALAYAVPENRAQIAQVLKASNKHQERIVETKVDHIEFSEDGTTATVEVTVKAFRVPVYVVNDTAREQRWVFSFAHGWQIAGIDEGSKDAA